MEENNEEFLENVEKCIEKILTHKTNEFNSYSVYIVKKMEEIIEYSEFTQEVCGIKIKFSDFIDMDETQKNNFKKSYNRISKINSFMMDNNTEKYDKEKRTN